MTLLKRFQAELFVGVLSVEPARVAWLVISTIEFLRKVLEFGAPPHAAKFKETQSSTRM